jgi:hypothetical protein
VIAPFLIGALVMATIGGGLQIAYLRRSLRERREAAEDTVEDVWQLRVAMAAPEEIARREALGRQARYLATARIRSSATLGVVHLLVASTGIAHLATGTPLLPTPADYWAAVARVLVSGLVILSTSFNLLARRAPR